MASASTNSPGTNTFSILLDPASVLPSTPNTLLQYIELSSLPDPTVTSVSNWHEDNILGRSEPYRSYMYSSSNIVSFTGFLVAMGTPQDRDIALSVVGGALGLTGRFVGQAQPFIGPAGKIFSAAYNKLFGRSDKEIQEAVVTSTYNEVTRKARWLEALTKTQYDDQGWAYPAPHVFLQHGQNWKRRGIIQSVSITWKGPWEVSTLLCMVVEAAITFVEDNQTPKSFVEVATGAPPERTPLKDSEYTGVQKAIDNARSLSGL
jgi:hypothetical protein